MATVLQLHDIEETHASSIRFLITSLSKQNVAAVIHTLTTKYFQPTNRTVALGRFALMTAMSAVLVDRQPTDEKVQLIQALIAAACDRNESHVVTLLADVFDSPQGVNFQSAEKLNDLLTKTLSLPRPHVVIVALSLAYAASEAWRDVASTVLPRLLAGVSAEQVATLLPPNLVLQLAMICGSIAPLRALSAELTRTPAPVSIDPPFTSTPTLSIAKVVEELGFASIATVEDCKDLLQMFPQPLSEKLVAELLCLAACPTTVLSSESNAYQSLRVSFGLAESKSSSAASTAATTAQMNVITQAVRDIVNPKSATEYWSRVMLALDQPQLRVERFSTIAAAFKKATNEPLPLILFVNDGKTRRWRNTGIQAAAIKFALDNPELMSREGLVRVGGQAAPQVRRVPSDIPAADDLSDLWRVEMFIDTVTLITAKEKELDGALQVAALKGPAVLLAGLLACATPAVRHFAIASQILKSATNLGSVVLPSVVKYLNSESCVGSLIAVLSELSQTEGSSRVFDIAEVCVAAGLTDAVLRYSPCTRLVVQVAMAARESGGAPEKWFEQLLSETNRARPNLPHSRFTVATAMLEAADDLLNRQRHTSSATHALQILAQSPFAGGAMAGVVAQAKLLLQGDNMFTPDIEEEATQFFQKMYADDSCNPMLAIERYHRSGVARDKQVLSCILRILFEEMRVLSDYPWKQLQTSARLYGQLIASDVLGPTRLQQALRLLLPTILRHTDMKTLEYGIIALEQFKMQLLEWPAVGKQLKNVVDLDMRIPGIMGLINQGIAKSIAEEQAAAAAAAGEGGKSSGTDKGAAADAAPNSGASGLHQLDIRVLMDKSGISHPAPPQIVQDQINFLVGNTDPQNTETNAGELKALIKPEFYSYFADYFVIKRVSLEPNNHKMYLNLVEKIGVRELEKRIRTATVNAVKRLLSSDRIRTDSNERSLLKNLGSWFGCMTLAKNIPVLARDLDFKEMLYQGLREGKLIAVVPFIAKVLEQSVHSRYFRPKNPWTMAQLGHLYELYRLPDLKLTLRFEVEVLCKNIDMQMAEVEEALRIMYPNGQTRRGVSMLELRSQLDINGSADFRIEEPRQQESPPPKPRGLQADAPPYQPRAVAQVEVTPPPRPPIVITPETVRAGTELRYLPVSRHAAYNQALVKTLEPALKEVQAHVERASVIAAYSAREIVIKDFARDPDPNLLRRAGQAMARSLASNLCTAIVKEHLSSALRKHIHVLATHLDQDAQTQNEITETVATNNFELCVRFLEYQSSELAGNKVHELLLAAAEEKANCLRKGEPLPFPHDQTTVQHLLNTLPEALRPNGVMPQAQRAVYEDFFLCIPVVEQLAHLIRMIEDSAARHYSQPNAEVLSLTNPLFTEKQLSEHHGQVRLRLVEIAQLIAPETAPLLIPSVFQRLMDVTEHLSRAAEQPTASRPVIATAQLLNEVLLFVIQSAYEKGKERALSEITRCYLNHDRRWKSCEVVVNLIRLRVIDIPRFDEALNKALQDVAPTSRNIVEFAGQLIQKAIIDEKIATTKDLSRTLAMLEQIARNRAPQQQQQLQQQPAQQQQTMQQAVAPGAGNFGKQVVQPQSSMTQQQQQLPTAAQQQQAIMAPRPLSSVASSAPAAATNPPASPSPYPPTVKQILLKSAFTVERRREIEQLFDEWIQICVKKAQGADSTVGAASGAAPATGDGAASAGGPAEQTQLLSMQYVKKLQQTNMLLTDRNQLDAFIGILIELSVEHYASTALEHERNALAAGGAASAAAMPQSRAAPPPPRFPFHGDLFLKCDAFSDLVVLLVRCCSWSQSAGSAPPSQENSARAEVALIGRVLQVAMRVLSSNHDAVQNQQEGPAMPNRPDVAYQKVFLQQPYVRILSNLLIAIHRNHPDSQPSATNEQNQNPTTEEILKFFSESLRGACPLKAPGFAFGWLECVAHRLLVVRMLRNRKLWPLYVSLLCEALKFLEFFTKGASGVPSNALVFAKSLLKLMLILLHDFPEFVLAWHVQLCDAIPSCCVQLRNVVLCAFPSNIKLPDPFAQNVHIDRLTEMQQAPPQQESYRKTIFTTASVTMDDIASYVTGTMVVGRQSGFAKTVLEAVRNHATGRWNVPLINAVVLHAASTYLASTQQVVQPTFADSPAMELYRELMRGLDNEGRYYFINACANHLRYPNSQTHFFSQALLHLFLPANAVHAAAMQSLQEIVQEQITRVLVERLIISRPHPWGLLITFIELIKNRRYGFWDKSFIRCTPEIEKMFDSLLKSISGSNGGGGGAAPTAATTAPPSAAPQVSPALPS